MPSGPSLDHVNIEMLD
uniref:Uncharacterized protein n=1 Tax=Anguilla anguilla TaxID=7936 RepID=A0A0E9UWI6_ANGAN